MKYVEGTAMSYLGSCDAVCFLTHGYVNIKEEYTMGSGMVADMKERFPALPKMLGARILAGGNHVNNLMYDRRAKPISTAIVSFPVRDHWRSKATIALIVRSAKELVYLSDKENWQKIVIPRPNYGTPKMLWRDVEYALANILDHRFIVTDETGGDE